MKKIIGLLVTLALILAVCPGAMAEEEAMSGQCGDNAFWQYDEGSEVLTISGTGEIWDYDYYTNVAPWRHLYWQASRLVIEAGITGTGEKSFYAMSNLQEIVLPDTLTTIDIGAFYQCSGLEKVVIPDSVTVIDVWGFGECIRLETITLPKNLATIGAAAFQGSGLTSVTLPASVTEVGNGAFARCEQLNSFQVEPGNTMYSAAEGFLFNGDGTELIRVPADLAGSYTVPGDVVRIARNAFQGTAVTEVILPDGMTLLNQEVFADCTALTNVVLPRSLEWIDSNAFVRSGITRLVIPENVRQIGFGVFEGCESLEALIFLGDEPYEAYFDIMYGVPETLKIYYSSEAQGWLETWEGFPAEEVSVTITQTATCTASGTQTITCDALDIQQTRPVKALGHDMNIWELERAATAEEPGQWNRVCSRCGHEETETIPKLANAGLDAAVTDNMGRQDYLVWTRVVGSYLVENAAGYQRIEYTGEYVTIEQYDREFKLLSQRGIAMELPLFGGFYTTGEYNFLVFGQENPNEEPIEVIRVVRYDMQWNRMDAAILDHVDIYIPFDAGSLRMAHNGDYLYIRTSDEGFALSDGNHHQAARQIGIHIPTMEIFDKDMEGFVSHSFNQFILVDGETYVYMDHGDSGDARGAILTVVDDIKSLDSVQLITAYGSYGQNATGVSMGGLVMSDSCYITAGNSIVQDGTVGFYGQRNIFVTATARDNVSAEGTTTIWLTDYTHVDDYEKRIQVSTPHLIQVEKNKFLILWTEGQVLKYGFLDGEGKPIGDIYSMEGALSDCVPLVTEGKVIWYVTGLGDMTFYSMDLAHPENVDTDFRHTHYWDEWTTISRPTEDTPGSERRMCLYCRQTQTREIPPVSGEETQPPAGDSRNPFTDISEGKYYYDAVLWAVEEGITTGKTATTFDPNGDCTRKQIVTFLWRALGQPEPERMENPFTDVKHDRFEKAILWAYYAGITTGTGDGTTFSPDAPCTRKQIVTFLWRFMGEPEPVTAENPFSDVKNDRFISPILWAYENGITTGKTATTFAPEATCSRCQIVTFLYRAYGEE